MRNTHFHGDHTGGNTHFGHEADIIAHANVRKHPGASMSEWPVITFDNSLSVHFNGEEIQIIHVPPGHTDSDSIILFPKSNVIHMSDQFFLRRFPNMDLDGGGDVRGCIRNVAEAIGKVQAGAKLIPGRGPLSTERELKGFHAMLVETSGIVEKAIAAGKSPDQVKADGLPEKWKSWAAPTITSDRWLELLYRVLSKKQSGQICTAAL